MYKKKITRFFKENGGSKKELPTAAMLAHFQIKLLQNDDANHEIHGLINKFIYEDQPNREKAVLEEKEQIESATCEQIIRFMRSGYDTINQGALVFRALEFEDELIPDIIKRLNTVFIEVSARVLSLCNKDIADELIAYFDDVRNPYAQSIILLVLGFKAKEAHIPWLIDKYKEMKQKYPDEDYSESVIYALGEIQRRFYSA